MCDRRTILLDVSITITLKAYHRVVIPRFRPNILRTTEVDISFSKS
ncbi:hypothetical protein F383_15140 [Gossypium arboreum]|uniref:Uncharacterized protein n=1 Tax=Gossypium arboreum TaxID=29729 RepID=A0A0B0NCK8_GOSAR|nr:hypothetical protein F383_15140 [Gossypium arboreum]